MILNWQRMWSVSLLFLLGSYLRLEAADAEEYPALHVPQCTALTVFARVCYLLILWTVGLESRT